MAMIALVVGVSLVAYLLFYMAAGGKGQERAGARGGLGGCWLVAHSAVYWVIVLTWLLVVRIGDCALEDDARACLDWQNRVLIISAGIAAVLYAAGMWAMTRKRR